jgi:LmbE family N-acetylglucosaminyl deacetylase
MSVLIVAAHPDDEVLGCGGTAYRLASDGIEVRACILSGQVEARSDKPAADELRTDTENASKILGLSAPILGNFPNIRFNTVPQLEIAQFIEEAILSTRAETIFTHHPGDLNDDHKHTSSACQAAARIFQRRPGSNPLKSLYFMEVPSSTDWAFPVNNAFRADTFFEIGHTGVDFKVKALAAYRGVIREFPHPRSDEYIRALAAVRGGQAGMRYAEAFQTAFNALYRS